MSPCLLRVPRAVLSLTLAFVASVFWCCGPSSARSPLETRVDLPPGDDYLLTVQNDELVAVAVSTGEAFLWRPRRVENPADLWDAEPLAIGRRLVEPAGGRVYEAPLPEGAHGARISPDGLKVVYFETRQADRLAILAEDGREPRRLAADADYTVDCRWVGADPLDAHRLACLEGRPWRVHDEPNLSQRLVLYDTDTGTFEALLVVRDRVGWMDFTVSPLGDQIVVARHFVYSGEGLRGSEFARAFLDGRPPESFYTADKGKHASYPVFSPQGDRLAMRYQSRQRDPDGHVPFSLGVLPAVGGMAREILDLPARSRGLFFNQAYLGTSSTLGWSPAGDQIAYFASAPGECTLRGDGGLDCTLDLYVAQADGGGTRRLTNRRGPGSFFLEWIAAEELGR